MAARMKPAFDDNDDEAVDRLRELWADPSLTSREIAAMFGVTRGELSAAMVRLGGFTRRRRGGPREIDPTPEEIAAGCAAIRAARGNVGGGGGDPRRPGIRTYTINPRTFIASFVD